MILGLEDFLHDWAAQSVVNAASQMMTDMLEDAPEETGELKASATGPEYQIDDPLLISATLGFDAPQADYTDQGTPPHEIFPVRAKALRFFWENGPNGAAWYSFDHVNHPGSPQTGWFSDKVDEWDQYIQDGLDQAYVEGQGVLF